MALSRDQVVRLATELRRLRESTWPGVELTQAQLAKAFSVEDRVGSATLSSWESLSQPKTPSTSRLAAYARFFCTDRSMEGEPHLLPMAELTTAEVGRMRDLQDRLLDLLTPDRGQRGSFEFDADPVVVICPTMPAGLQGELADELNHNYTRLRRYGDLDALVELFGFLNSVNPSLDVYHRIATEVTTADLTGHVILLGGIGWNGVTRRLHRAFNSVPIRQIEVDDLVDGEIFELDDEEGHRQFRPEFDDYGAGEELSADVGLIARLRHPFRINRTLTICNGVFSRGVLGAVRCLTDPEVRDENERFMARRFPGGEFAVLLRVPVVAGQTVSPDLQDPATRLFEWSPLSLD